MTIIQQAIIIGAGIAATMLTRFIPFLVFRPGKPTPKYISYLGKVLPPSVFALLVVYCLRTVFATSYIHTSGWHISLSADAAQQCVGILATIAIHLWRKNLMLSIAMGTLTYMLLV